MHAPCLGQHKLGWRKGFGGFFLLWMLLDLCVVHLLCPQYAASELFGCAVPAVVAAPSSGEMVPEDGGVPGLMATVCGSNVTEEGIVTHSCLWNTQSVVEASPLVVSLLPCNLPASGSHGDGTLVFHARLFPSAIFHPPRLS